MDEQLGKCKLVFLIDSSLANCQQGCRHLYEIVATTLRIISFFETSISKQRDDRLQDEGKFSKTNLHSAHVSWGYKLFNTTATLPRKTASVSNPDFQSRKYKHVEDFVTKLQGAFDDVIKDFSKRRSLSKPAELLSVALTEILHDFSWDSLDLVSTKVTVSSTSRTRRKSSQSFAEDVFHCGVVENAVFILSKAPRNKKSFRWFSNKMVIDSDVFIDSFMSPALQQAYKNKTISLSWIDVGSPQCGMGMDIPQGVPTQDSVLILRDAMRKLGGFLSQQSFFMQDSPPEVSRHNCWDATGLGHALSVQAHLSSLTARSRQRSTELKEIFIDVHGCTATYSIMPVSHRTLQGAPRDPSLNDSIRRLDQLTVLGCLPKSYCDRNLVSNLCPTHIVYSKTPEKLSTLIKELFLSRSCAILRTQTSCLAILSPCTSNIASLSLVGTQYLVKTKLTPILRLNESFQHQASNTTAGKSAPVKDEHFFRACSLNSWYVPGSAAQLRHTVDKISERLDGHDQPCSQKSVLKDLRKFYAREKQPPELVHNPAPAATSTPLFGPTSARPSHSGGSDSTSQSRSRLSRLTRGRLMVDRAKSASLLMADDLDSSLSSKAESPDRRASSSFGGSCGLLELNLKTEEDLSQYLRKQYDQVVNAGIAMETTVQTMVTLTSRLMADLQHSNPQKSAVAFIREHLLLTSFKLKEKYSCKATDEALTGKLSEYKLQILLLLELESLLLENSVAAQEELTSELVSMLRVVSFSIGPAGLQEFLKDNVLANYHTNLAKVLVDVYDELMLPLPSILEKFASPSAPSSVWGAVPSVGEDSMLSGPGSSQPRSNMSDQALRSRSGKLKAHPSFSDFGQKRQILVKPKVAPKTSKSEKKKGSKDVSKAKSRESKRRPGVDHDRAKKNLFSDTPQQSKLKSRSRSRHRKHTSSSGQSRLLVPGTPAHKQTSSRIRAQQERRRQKHNVKTDVVVVAESPVKDDGKPVSQMDKPAQYLVREAFYSSSSQPSRNLAKSLELAQSSSHANVSSHSYLRSSQRAQGSLASAVRGESPLLSPGGRLMKSLMASPSPDRKAKHTYRSPSTPVRRSPRKSVKKLDFKDCAGDVRRTPGASSSSLDAHLIFDGENATDSNLFKSPEKRKYVPQSPFRTPEKSKSPFSHVSMGAASCPPAQSTPPKRPRQNLLSQELNFKNVLSAQNGNGGTPLTACDPAHSTGSETPKRKSHSSRLSGGDPNVSAESPTKAVLLSSPDWASRFGSNMVLRSPAKRLQLMSDSAKGVIHHCSEGESPRRLSNPSEKIRGSHGSSPRKERRVLHSKDRSFVGEVDDPHIPTSTPEKLSKLQTRHLSTPSKVKFSNRGFISPPTGSGYPPSAEKSTPGKSILKSPGLKLKQGRRVELVSLGSSSSGKHSNFMEKLNASTVDSSILGNSVQKSITQDNVANTTDHGVSSTHLSASSQSFDVASSKSSRSLSKSTLRRQSSSDDDSSDLFNTSAQESATIKIRTPSPASKTKTPDSINKWMRRKRLSGSKHSSSSSSGPSSSQSSSSSTEEKVKSSNKGNIEQKSVPELTEPQSRKRNRPQLENEIVSESPRKRVRRILNPKDEENSKENAFVERKGTSDFDPLFKVDIISNDGDNDVFPVGKQMASDVSLSRQPSLISKPSADTALSFFHQPLYSPIGTSSCEWYEGGSQGFPVSHTETDKKKADSCADKEVSKDIHEGGENVAGPSGRSPGSVTESVVCDKASQQMPKKASGHSNSSGSPIRSSFSTSPSDKKQYSPSLSASGLLHLIKSPLLSDREVRSKQVNTRAKSRKHLDLN
ncbi:treslin isoform X2 [Aplysia californica]|uniref:Treslin isoform X2 n=1 Tax=Aplysia californica TaxID=6500 RepID=A0ABM1ABL4_APLCA|nr:treslin isoform X2 [Aplysia californica]